MRRAAWHAVVVFAAPLKWPVLIQLAATWTLLSWTPTGDHHDVLAAGIIGIVMLTGMRIILAYEAWRITATVRSVDDEHQRLLGEVTLLKAALATHREQTPSREELAHELKELRGKINELNTRLTRLTGGL